MTLLGRTVESAESGLLTYIAAQVAPTSPFLMDATFRSLHARLEAANPEKRRGGVVGQGARKALVPRLGLAALFAQILMRGHNVAAGHSIGAPLMALRLSG